jgi:hypothetical protein
MPPGRVRRAADRPGGGQGSAGGGVRIVARDGAEVAGGRQGDRCWLRRYRSRPQAMLSAGYTRASRLCCWSSESSRCSSSSNLRAMSEASLNSSWLNRRHGIPTEKDCRMQRDTRPLRRSTSRMIRRRGRWSSGCWRRGSGDRAGWRCAGKPVEKALELCPGGRRSFLSR